MPSGIYAECHLCWLSIMLSVKNKPLMLSVAILIVVVLIVIMPSVVAPLYKTNAAVFNQRGLGVVYVPCFTPYNLSAASCDIL